MDRFKMFNCFFIIVLVAILLTSISVIFIRYNNINHEDKVYIKRDTVYVYVEDSTSVAQIDSLCTVIDSLKQNNEVLFDELSVAIFKLERIRDYNEIAKNGNNIKYLRGWINRVLND